MKRLYYLTRSVEEADRLVKDLYRYGVGEWHIRGLSQDDAGLYHHHIHPANFFQRYDLVHLGERGAIAGFLISLLWSLGVHFMHLIPASFGTAETMFTILIFTLFGAWSGGLVGISRLNYRISRFSEDIASGACLVLVDTPRNQSHKIAQMVEKKHPYFILAGCSSTFTNPFSGPAQRHDSTKGVRVY
ncbi:hypothetical protein M3P05_05735 [Sansalvadorimonas sp. 2012CJ34-2]|uniref:Uncharacterized protein n=1 Tax=Parendozoicomonas callyspongiae TaxID=2942213 RepID=A0ABT0PDL0_9GAMM|nr:hypothetical protein [Sansalvadorimonas sp. 2012CJ34-2]MCL6269445.1 hypothetical protein [Sansalvadorimonas sp. 2012CJ34-2]